MRIDFSDDRIDNAIRFMSLCRSLQRSCGSRCSF